MLSGFRLFITMIVALILAWTMRACAIGQGAGTQAVIIPLWMLALGQPVGLSRDLLLSPRGPSTWRWPNGSSAV